MLRKILLASALVCSPFASAFAYSNVVVFGDSLSDIGNMPESYDVYDSDMKNALALNLYVPISNPVISQDGTSETYKVPGTDKNSLGL